MVECRMNRLPRVVVVTSYIFLFFVTMPGLLRYRLSAAVKALVVQRANGFNQDLGIVANGFQQLRMPPRAWFTELLGNLRIIGAIPLGASTTVETLRNVVRTSWRAQYPLQHVRKTRVHLDANARTAIVLRAEAWTDEYRGGDQNSAPPRSVCQELCDFLKAEGVIPTPSTVNGESVRTLIRTAWGLKD